MKRYRSALCDTLMKSILFSRLAADKLYFIIRTSPLVCIDALLQQDRMETGVYVAISALELDTGLSKQSIIRARNALQQSGRIIVRTRKGNQSAIYQMVPFAYQYGTQSNTQSSTQTVAYHRGTQNDTQSDTLPDTQADTQTDTLPDTQSDTIPRHRLDKTRLEEDPAATTRACAQNKIGEVMQCYQKNIRPICSEIEGQKLYDMVEHYGKDAVLKAIERAVLRGGRTLSYINGILLSWEQHGYDEEAEHGNEDRTNAARRRNGKPVRRENKRSQRRRPDRLERRARWMGMKPIRITGMRYVLMMAGRA